MTHIAMERSTIFAGKPSISIRAIYTMAMLVITRGYIIGPWGNKCCRTSGNCVQEIPRKSILPMLFQHIKSRWNMCLWVKN